MTATSRLETFLWSDQAEAAAAFYVASARPRQRPRHAGDARTTKLDIAALEHAFGGAAPA